MFIANNQEITLISVLNISFTLVNLCHELVDTRVRLGTANKSLLSILGEQT